MNEPVAPKILPVVVISVDDEMLVPLIVPFVVDMFPFVVDMFPCEAIVLFDV